MDASGKWHFEVVTLDLMMLYRFKEVLHTGKTAYQNVDILESHAFGRCLVLDGKTQSSEADEHIYHECLVHPTLLAHPDPRTIFIGGGGEGATLREVLGHHSVQRVVMVDLDEEVVGLCRRYLPEHHKGAFDDPRVELRHEDARAYLAQCDDLFDVIILDLVDPLEGGPSCLLYTLEFYEIVKSKLNPGGILVTQAGPTGLLNYTECFTSIARTLSICFPTTWPYITYVPSFVSPWGFVLACKNSDVMRPPDASDIDELIPHRLAQPLRYLDSITYRGLFHLPKYLREGIEIEQRIVTDTTPIFMV